jgi:hypothetical protein
MDEKRYVIWSNEHQAWWRPNSHGYTRWIEDAGRYARDEAVSISNSGDMSTPEGNRECETMLLAPEFMEA